MIEPVGPEPLPQRRQPGQPPLRAVTPGWSPPPEAVQQPGTAAPTAPPSPTAPTGRGETEPALPPVTPPPAAPLGTPQPARPRGADGAEPDGVTPIGPRHDSGRRRGLGGGGGGGARGSGGRSSQGPSQPREPVSAGRAAVGAVTEIVVVLGMALILSLLIKTFLVQAFFIPSASMETTLLTGDRVLVSKLTPGPFSLHHGDIVVFKDPGGWLGEQPPPDDGAAKKLLRETLTFVGLLPQDSGEHLIKRVIGMPGDTVACCNDRGQMTVNGVAIDETPYLYAGDQPNSGKGPFSVTVPAGKLWVMGDHRSVSEDSRAHRDLDGGFVPIDDVVGKAFVIVWPFDRAGGLGVPDQVFADVPEKSGS